MSKITLTPTDRGTIVLQVGNDVRGITFDLTPEEASKMGKDFVHAAIKARKMVNASKRNILNGMIAKRKSLNADIIRLSKELGYLPEDQP